MNTELLAEFGLLVEALPGVSAVKCYFGARPGVSFELAGVGFYVAFTAQQIELSGDGYIADLRPSRDPQELCAALRECVGM